MLVVVALFLPQYGHLNVLVGSLSGSVALGAVRLLDVFAFLESQFAARELALAAVVAVLPVAGLYLVVGRAFCGWVCPMDFLFALVARGTEGGRHCRLSPRTGYAVAGAFLLGSLLAGIPLFTNYLSHLTNFFRAIGSAAGLGQLPGSLPVLVYSASAIGLLLVLEWISPRLWCQALCPVGKTYGLFNRISLLRLHLPGSGCNGCQACERVCYMGVRIAGRTTGRELRDSNCIYCGRCVEACRENDDVIRMGFRRNRKNEFSDRQSEQPNRAALNKRGKERRRQ